MAEADVYDGIIAGGGHNGLILQACLARAGLRTLTAERNPRVGGGNITGLFGGNAARIVAEDLGLTPWWSPPHLRALRASLA